MVRADLIQALLDQNLELGANDAQKLVIVFFEQIAKHLAAGGRVELRGFGSFEAREHDARMARNPKTGEEFALDVRRVPRFKPAEKLRAMVNYGKADA